MPPRSRHAQSGSVASNSSAAEAVNGIISGTSASKSSSPALTAPRKRGQSRGTASPAGAPVVLVPKSAVRAEPAIMSQGQDFQPFKFITTVVLSTVLEAGLQTLASTVGVGDLAAVSKRPGTWNEILSLLGWKIGKLATYWANDFDGYDVASITLLLNTPPALLLALFYQISPTTVVSTTISSMIANSLPYYFLRPISPSHAPQSVPKSTLRNWPILTDPYTTVATSLLASAIFAVLLQASFATYLPTWLVLHFVGLRTIEPAHLGPAGLPTLLLALLPAGYAVMEFIFAPSTAATATSTIVVAPSTTPAPAFDPATATFWDHARYNSWGWYTTRQQELIRRTVLLVGLIFAETILSTWGAIEGVELQGAIIYACIWALGSGVTGVVLEWVGAPSD